MKSKLDMLKFSVLCLLLCLGLAFAAAQCPGARRVARVVFADTISTGPGVNLLSMPAWRIGNALPGDAPIEGVPESDGDVPWTVSFSGATW